MRSILFSALAILLLLSGCEKTNHPSGGYQAAKAAIGKGRPVMLEVGADYCTACQDMKTVIALLKSEQPDLPIHMVNVTKARDAAEALGVRMIPTQIFYDASGKEVYRHVGGYGEAEFRSLLKQYKILKEK